MSQFETAPDGARFVPFSVRGDPERVERFLTGSVEIPAGMRGTLLDWCVGVFWTGGYETIRKRVRTLEMLSNRSLSPRALEFSVAFRSELDADDSFLLDATDIGLRLASLLERSELSTILELARSALETVDDEHGHHRLRRRQPREMVELASATVSGPSRAAEHLQIAWSKCFGRPPEPNEACREAVCAIEAAAKPTLTPKDRKPTLGKMIRAIKDKQDAWTTDLDTSTSVTRIMGMMEMVWEDHLRHGNTDEPLELSVEAAEILVQTSVLLVHWFETGRFRRLEGD